MYPKVVLQVAALGEDSVAAVVQAGEQDALFGRVDFGGHLHLVPLSRNAFKPVVLQSVKHLPCVFLSMGDCKGPS